MISFDVTKKERDIIHRIAERAFTLWGEKEQWTITDIRMDITATHCNGCPLRLSDLLAADDFNFLHDTCGIYGHLNRKTGKLERCFSPRFSDYQKRKELQS